MIYCHWIGLPEVTGSSGYAHEEMGERNGAFGSRNPIWRLQLRLKFRWKWSETSDERWMSIAIGVKCPSLRRSRFCVQHGDDECHAVRAFFPLPIRREIWILHFLVGRKLLGFQFIACITVNRVELGAKTIPIFSRMRNADSPPYSLAWLWLNE